MNILRLQEILSTVQTYFDRQFRAKQFWCKAEVMHIKQHKNRVYLDLVEYDATGVLVAKIKAIIREKDLLDLYLHAHGLANYEALEGKVLLFEANCSFHAQRGLSLSIIALSHEFARGQLAVQQEQTRKYLMDIGIYSKNKEQLLGMPPLRLAVISSATSEGLRDFMTILEQSVYRVDIQLFPCAIHGESAKQEVVAMLQKVAERSSEFSAVIITRGGGGGEGLVRQHDPQIAESICRMPLPVMLATGHTVDVSLLDELVWQVAKTPSDAAYRIIEILTSYDTTVQYLFQTSVSAIASTLFQYQQAVVSYSDSIHRMANDRTIILQQMLSYRYTAIETLVPQKMLMKGYALVCDSDGNYLSRKQLQQLEHNELLTIKIYDMQLTMKMV